MNWFLILSYASIGFIVIYAIYNIVTKKKGNWSNFDIDFRTLQFKKPKGDKKMLSRGERECKRVLEDIYKRPFRNMRPDFLRNNVTGGNNLELDCYNPEIKVACEYNGKQHYEYNTFFHRNKDNFLNQKYRDDMKRRICKENGVILIEVPYSVDIPDIEDFIKKKLRAIKQDQDRQRR